MKLKMMDGYKLKEKRLCDVCYQEFEEDDLDMQCGKSVCRMCEEESK